MNSFSRLLHPIYYIQVSMWWKQIWKILKPNLKYIAKTIWNVVLPNEEVGAVHLVLGVEGGSNIQAVPAKLHTLTYYSGLRIIVILSNQPTILTNAVKGLKVEPPLPHTHRIRMETESKANSRRCFLGENGRPLTLCSR